MSRRLPLLATSALVSVLLSACSAEPDAVPTATLAGDPEFIGREACSPCHQREAARWQGSHHDLAMQEASEATVLGDFQNATFSYAGVTSSFYRRDGAFFVRTDGPDGDLHDYEISYTFGVTPLQQYLIAFPDGRYQALNMVSATPFASPCKTTWPIHSPPDIESV